MCWDGARTCVWPQGKYSHVASKRELRSQLSFLKLVALFEELLHVVDGSNGSFPWEAPSMSPGTIMVFFFVSNNSKQLEIDV